MHITLHIDLHGNTVQLWDPSGSPLAQPALCNLYPWLECTSQSAGRNGEGWQGSYHTTPQYPRPRSATRVHNEKTKPCKARLGVTCPTQRLLVTASCNSSTPLNNSVCSDPEVYSKYLGTLVPYLRTSLKTQRLCSRTDDSLVKSTSRQFPSTLIFREPMSSCSQLSSSRQPDTLSGLSIGIQMYICRPTQTYKTKILKNFQASRSAVR